VSALFVAYAAVGERWSSIVGVARRAEARPTNGWRWLCWCFRHAAEGYRRPDHHRALCPRLHKTKRRSGCPRRRCKQDTAW